MSVSSSPIATPKKTRTAKNSLRRAMFFIIGLGIGLFIIGMMLIIEASPIALLPQQVSILGDIFFIVLMLCPLMLCTFPLYLLLVVSVFGLIRLDAGAGFRLRKLQITSKNLQRRSDTLAKSLSKRSIQFNARAEFLRPLFRIFDRPKDTDNDGKQRKLEE